MSFELPPSGGLRDSLQSKWDSLIALKNRFVAWFVDQKPGIQILIVLLVILGFVLELLVIIYHNKVLEYALSLSKVWREMPGGTLLMFCLIFGVSFPPLLGFSALSTMTGMIWGFPNGWPILASASISGSLCSFLLFRYVLKDKARQLMQTSKTFELSTLVLNDDNALLLLLLIRLCPLPYSLSNGLLLLIPGIRLPTFVLASVVTSPKLLIPIFIGSKLQDLDASKSTSERIISLLSIIITLAAFSTLTYLIYQKMQEKMNEIDQGLNLSLDEEGNFEIDDENFLRDDDYEEDNLVV